MADQTMTGSDARALRERWFRFLDTIEPIREGLHAYCLSLTGSVWDAEDLVQDTLLRGFGMMARGDLHGDNSRVRDARAYLFRTAINAWLDVQRRRRGEATGSVIKPAFEDPDPTVPADAVAKLISRSSPQEFAAIILKELYDFSLDEIADFVGTTTGTVKSALYRARRKMESEEFPDVGQTKKRFACALVDAINAQDLDRVRALMAESIHITVCNVSGGRGSEGVWAKKSLPGSVAEYCELQGEPVIVFRDRSGATPNGLIRIDASDEAITRIVDYCYAPETLRLVAEGLKISFNRGQHHQPQATIQSMVSSTDLPWREYDENPAAD